MVKSVQFFQIIAVLLLGLVVGCSPTFRYHGYTPTEEQLASIIVGVDTRGSVADSIGLPQSRSVLDDNGWYYISSKVRHFTYNEPEVIEREMVAISFDANDVVTNIERFALADGRVITLNRRVTTLPVKGPNFLGQILSNLGRIDASQLVGN